MSVSFSTIVQRARPATTHAANAAFKDILGLIPPTNVSFTPNGVRVACEENPNATFATVGLMLNAGTRHDLEGYFGTARVFEKCGFLGTANQNRDAIARAVDELGGQLSVETGREHSYLLMKVAKENVNKAVGVLADIVRNARLSDEDIASAKQQVLQQRAEFEERPDDVLEDNLFRQAYDSSVAGLGAPTFGTVDGINAVDRDVLVSFRNTNIVAPNVVVVGAGGVNHTELEKAAAQYLGDLSSTAVKRPVQPRYVGGEFRLWNLRFKTCHIMWGVETCGAACEDSLPLTLATQVFGGFHRGQHELGQHNMHRVMKMYASMDFSGPTTCMFNEKGIETVNSYIRQFSDTGLCGMHIVGRKMLTGPGGEDSMHEFLQYSMIEWCRITQKALHAQELDLAKANLKSQILFDMDGSHNTAKDMGRQVLYFNRRVSPAEMYARIDDITVTNVMETLQHYYYGARPVFSYNGVIYPIPNYDWSSMWTYKSAY
jgi:predicted Zn-dependent peptidase